MMGEKRNRRKQSSLGLDESNSDRSENLTVLKRLIGIENRKISLIFKFIQNFNSETNTISQINVQLQKLENTRISFDTLIERCCRIADDVDLPELQVLFDRFDESNTNAKSKLVELSKTFKTRSLESVRSHSSSNAIEINKPLLISSQTEQLVYNSDMKKNIVSDNFQQGEHQNLEFKDLNVQIKNSEPNKFSEFSHKFSKITHPPLQIPNFNGDYLKWVTFRDIFQAHIHNRTDIDDVVKYTYLLEKLQGEALHTIGQITVSSKGYQSAWNNLCQRYDNVSIIVDQHVEAILNLPFCSKESSQELWTLLNDCNAHICALESCGQVLSGLSELMIISLVKRRMDSNSLKEWESTLQINELPTWDHFITFLKKRCHILQNIESLKSKRSTGNVSQLPNNNSNQKFNKQVSYNPSRNSNKFSSFVSTDQPTVSNISKCSFCKEFHYLFNCQTFLKLSTVDRYNFIINARMCTNCLKPNHINSRCTSLGRCKYCNGKHNSLIHRFNPNVNSLNPNKNQQANNKPSIVSQNTKRPSTGIDTQYTNTQNSNFKTNQITPVSVTDNQVPCSSQTSLSTQVSETPYSAVNKVLLSTALILIEDHSGKYHLCRALLDSASQSNFITVEFAMKLGLSFQNINLPISSLNNNQTNIKFKSSACIKSRISDFKNSLDFLIVPTITNNLPFSHINISKWNIPINVELADPNFNISSKVDVLLGAEIFFKILKSNKFQLQNNLPFMQDTLFGYILSGKYEESLHNFCSLSEENPTDSLNNLLQKFWEIESYPVRTFLSVEEKECEAHFIKTHTRDDSGRYIVRLPFLKNHINLGESRSQAEKRFLYLERRLNNDLELKMQYTDFINDYITLGHMKIIDENKDPDNDNKYYMPHHAVLKPTSSTTKLRVVFDASAKTTTNLSLNDVLMVGPTVQDTLFSIMLRFRKYKYVFTADITKMYRQVKVDEKDHKFQRILWRNNPNENIKTFELTTVTYGTASAPYLATRVLQQLSIDESNNFPLVSEVIANDFYVDDILTGSDILEDAKLKQVQLIYILYKAGFTLHKWSSNCNELLKNIPLCRQENACSQNHSIKTLGLIWQPTTDTFLFSVHPCNTNEAITKRTILSNVARLYDPLGLLSPVIITAKLLIQDLWKTKLGWDDVLNSNENYIWTNFRNKLASVNEIKLTRHIIAPNNPIKLELYGFSDASSKA